MFGNPALESAAEVKVNSLDTHTPQLFMVTCTHLLVT
jgi:hypothetical protein